MPSADRSLWPSLPRMSDLIEPKRAAFAPRRLAMSALSPRAPSAIAARSKMCADTLVAISGCSASALASEVQRLAERAANATKQIEVLVRTIQTDTNEAVVSMERSTTDVVGGALLAENAGAALEEIEQVSN